LARYTEFYRGRRKKRNYMLIPFIILVILITFLVVVFHALQKYAVISDDGINIVLPGMEDKNVVVDSQGNETKVFEEVDVELIFDPADYSNVKAVAGKYLKDMRAIFVPAGDIYLEKLDEYMLRLNVGNALVLEMKPRSGVLMWNSMATEAQNYGLSMPTEQTNNMQSLIDHIKSSEKNIYLVAQISCCIDELYASRCTTVTLRTPYGANYMDVEGTWLDPYNPGLRDYTVDLVKELFEMGFDEVVLADVAHPTVPLADDGTKQELVYTKQMSTPPSSVNAVCGFAVYVADQLRDREGVLSIYCDSKPALVRADENNGQDAVLFMKIFDRVYLETDKYAYPYNVSDIENNVTIGDVHQRLVPVVINYLPDNPKEYNWVLVDAVEEPKE